MKLRSLVRSIVRPKNAETDERNPNRVSRNRSGHDIYFTAQFHAKAAERGLTEAHARFVYEEGEAVAGKPGMRVCPYKGDELGIYVFHDRETNQPVVTSIWKRPHRAPSRKRGR